MILCAMDGILKKGKIKDVSDAERREMSRIVGLKAVEMSNPNASSRKTSGIKTASPCKIENERR